ncbi:MAG: hypothetical protein IJ154_07230 [Bacteroidales bacterium]|nr:hypothetical protein [Bacteroidales bacterium]
MDFSWQAVQKKPGGSADRGAVLQGSRREAGDAGQHGRNPYPADRGAVLQGSRREAGDAGQHGRNPYSADRQDGISSYYFYSNAVFLPQILNTAAPRRKFHPPR